MRLRRQPSSGLTIDPSDPRPIFNDPPDGEPAPGPMNPGGGASGTEAGAGGAPQPRPGTEAPNGPGIPPIPPPPMFLPGTTPNANPGNLFLGNYVPLQNYLYANQGRQIIPTSNGAPAPAADGSATPPVGLGSYGLDQALLQQASPNTSVPGVDPTGGAGGTGSGVPQQPAPPQPSKPKGPPRPPNGPVTELVAGGTQSPPMVAQQQPNVGNRLRKYFYPGQSY